MKNEDPINNYFLAKGINVSYNTLNGTQDLVRAYVKQFEQKVKDNKDQKSQFIKHACYNEIYNIENRTKFTGFEKYKKIDNEFRKSISPLINTVQFSPTLLVDNADNHVTDTYKNLLKGYVKQFNHPLLYLSGGMDSELVALAMIESGVKFYPVIFNYVNNLGQTLNLFDSTYAYQFCAKHGLFPITNTLNIEELWGSKDFTELALELQISSPHLVTHAYMVKIMSINFPDHTHVFGGEVRFYTHHTLDDGRQASLVLLAKNNPVGYNAQAYITTSYSSLNSNNYVYYSFTNGLGSVNNFIVNQNYDYAASGAPLSGPWSTSSTVIQSVYEWRIVSITGISQLPLDGSLSSISPLPASVPTSWSVITPGTTQVAAVDATASATVNASVTATFTIEVRNQAIPVITVSSTISLESISYEYGPP